MAAAKVSKPRRLFFALGAIAVAATWFTWLRPATLGGDVSYVIVDGSSMEPTYEDGDLVLVREERSYEHGDIIAFRAGGTFDDQTRIIHRIVDEDGNGFVTQGDNRDATDPWRPTDDDVIGRARLHVPMAGDVAAFVTRPQSFAALGATAALVGGTRRRRRRRPPAAATPTRRSGAPAMSRTERIVRPPHEPRRLAYASRWERLTHPRWAFVGLIGSALLAVPILGMTWSALRAPDSLNGTEAVGVVDYAIGLDYRFSGPASAVYPDGVVTASRSAAGAVVPDDPLYSRLLTELEVTVGFRATEQGADRLASTAGMVVEVTTPAGWSTVLATVEPAEFRQSTQETTIIDLRDIESQVAAVADLTGVGGDSYTITVRPSLGISGTAADSSAEETLTSPMTFDFEGNLITANAVETSETTELTRKTSEPAEYAIGPYEMRTQPARAVLSGLALVVVAGLAWFASVLFGGLGLGEPARIAARYRSQIVDVAAATAPPGPVVMVGGIDELARIARVEQSVILHEDLGDGAHRYRVFLGSVTYEYETAPEHAAAASDEPVNTDETGG